MFTRRTNKMKSFASRFRKQGTSDSERHAIIEMFDDDENESSSQAMDDDESEIIYGGQSIFSDECRSRWKPTTFFVEDESNPRRTTSKPTLKHFPSPKPAQSPKKEMSTSLELQEFPPYNRNGDMDEEQAETSSIGTIQLSETMTGATAQRQLLEKSGPWSSRTKLEKILIVVLVILLAILILMIIFYRGGLFSERKVIYFTDKDEDQACQTPSCVKTAAQVLSSIDPATDPCEDFYLYACGGWLAHNPLPEGKSIWGTFGKLEQQNQLVIRNLIENPETVYASEAEYKAKLYYDSCMDLNDTIEKLGTQPMLDLIDKLGGWNIAGKFKLAEWSLQEALEVIHNEYNMGGLFAWTVGEDDKNSSRYVIQIEQGGLALPTRDNYLDRVTNKNILNAYLEYMTRVGVLLGGDFYSTRIQMEKVIEFETKLAYIMQPEEELRDEMKLYHLMPLSELQKAAPFISWVPYFQRAMKDARRISSSEKVVVHSPEYMERLSELLLEYTNSDSGKITLSNYLIWQTVRSFTCCLPKSFREAYRGLRKVLTGSEGGEEPWLSCISDTNNVAGFALGAMFVREVFNNSAKAVAEEMINEVRSAFLKNLETIPWMDEETRKAAIEKANAITDMIGFPEFIMDPQLLDKKYKDLVIKKNEYFMNVVRVFQFNLRKNVERLNEPVSKSRWDMTPSTANAYYTPTKNQIVFPAGILQAPFYDVTNPASWNYGSMGVVMGHELTHAFDDMGKEYDLNGNLNKWWNNETTEHFTEKTECVVHQYSEYQINGVHVNGRQTLGENIADNGGLKAAYNAYVWKWKQELEKQALPGLAMTHKQLFFLSFAQVWCTVTTPEAALLQLEKDPHSPSKFRVNGPLSNMKEFSEAFKCTVGSKMNPAKKCTIWVLLETIS